MKGLVISIYRSGKYDCTNGGVSATADEALVVGPGIPGIFEAHDRPVLILKPGNVRGTVKLVPAVAEGKWTMFGGNFAHTSDSRFGDAVRAIVGGEFYGAVAIHDRIEG